VNGGNQTHTAAQLHIGAATLYRKLKSYGLIGRKRNFSAARETKKAPSFGRDRSVADGGLEE
jgi:hypothetical protein